MNQSSRQKLNSVRIVGSIGVAAIFAALTGSGLVFIVVAGVLIASSLNNGDIRPARIGKRQPRDEPLTIAPSPSLAIVRMWSVGR